MYVCVCVCVFFSLVNLESGIIQSGQLNYSNFKYLNLPGKELNSMFNFFSFRI